MYRTYLLTEKEKDNPFVISHWDGDTSYYTICESKEEYESEKARLKRINDEYKKAKKEYLKNCKSY